MTEADIEIEDPIIELLERLGGENAMDGYVAHMVSLSDVIKNDMRKLLEWDESVLHTKLRNLVEHGLDKNGRYNDHPMENVDSDQKSFPKTYIEIQCLLTKWLMIYHSLRTYERFLVKRIKSEAAAGKAQSEAAGRQSSASAG